MKPYVVSVYHLSSDPLAIPAMVRHSVVGVAAIETVEAAMRGCPDDVKEQIRTHRDVRLFIEHGAARGEIIPRHWMPGTPKRSWSLCIGPIDEVLL